MRRDKNLFVLNLATSHRYAYRHLRAVNSVTASTDADCLAFIEQVQVLHFMEEAGAATNAAVIIVGGGPVGLMLCACVVDAGGRPVGVGARSYQTCHPKMTYQRPQHGLFRRYDLEQALRDVGVEANCFDVSWITSLAGRTAPVPLSRPD